MQSIKAIVPIGILLASLSFAAQETRADILLNTTAAPGVATGGPLLVAPGVNGQSLAVRFITTSSETVNSILATLYGTGQVQLGIMADASGVPSDSFLYSATVTNPTDNISLTGLSWSLNPGTYWLTAEGLDNFYGTWQAGARTNTNTVWDYSSTTFNAPHITSWNSGLGTPPPQATISASITSAVPEPEIFAMLATGLGILGWVGQRKKPGSI